MTKATDCIVDEAIRYFAAIHAIWKEELAKFSIVTRVFTANLRKLADVNSSMAVY